MAAAHKVNIITGFWFVKLSSRKSPVLSRFLFTLSSCRNPRYLSSISYLNCSPDFAIYRARLCIHTKQREHVRKYGSHQTFEESKKQEEPPVTDSSDSTSHHHTTTILQRLQDLEESFRVRGHSILRWGLSALVIAGFVIYIFREPLRENVADEVADVASRSLGKSSFKRLTHSVGLGWLQQSYIPSPYPKLNWEVVYI